MRLPSLVGIAGLVALAAGCSIGSSSHSTLTLSQAEQRAHADGLVSIHRQPQASYVCTGHDLSIGAKPLAGGKPPGVVYTYSFSFNDRRARPTLGRQIIMFVIVFNKPGYAARCAAGGQYGFAHQPGQNGLGVQPTRRITSDILYAASGYDTWVTHGDAIGLGGAGKLRDIRMVEADLTRLTAQISG